MKKFLSVFFALTILLCAMPLSVSAEEAAEEKPAETVTIFGAEVPADTKALKVCSRTFRAEAEKNEYTGLEDDELIRTETNEQPLDIKEIYSKLPELRRLTAAGLPIKNPEYLSKFGNLRTLELYECTGFDDASFLADCKGVTVLRVSVNTSGGVCDLSEIGKMTQLKKLSLLYLARGIKADEVLKCYGGDVSFLKNLTNLKELKLHEEYLTDLSALSSLKKLTVLDLDVEARADIKALSKLSNLTELTYCPWEHYEDYYYDDDYEEYDETVDLSPLKKLKKLKKLSLYGLEVYDDDFAGLKNLKELSLYYVGVLDRSDKFNFTLPRLDKLYLKETFIPAEMLAGFRTLKELTLEDCGDTVYYADENADGYGYGSSCYDISYVKNMKNLKKLTVTDYGVNDIEVLSGLTKLEYLDLSHNFGLEDLSPLKGLKNLKYLDLEATNYYGSKKNYIEPLKEIKSLEYLNIYDVYGSEYCYADEWFEERERSLKTVSGLKNLKTLIVSGEHTRDSRNINKKEAEETRKRLKKSLPDCEIIFRYPLILVD